MKIDLMWLAVRGLKAAEVRCNGGAAVFLPRAVRWIDTERRTVNGYVEQPDGIVRVNMKTRDIDEYNFPFHRCALVLADGAVVEF